MSRETWREDVAAGRAHACNVDEAGGARELETPGRALLRYHRDLALEQRDAEERRAYRRRIETAASGAREDSRF